MAKMTKAEKKRAAARARRTNKAVNLMNVAEAYVQTSIWTDAAFRLNPIQFVMGRTQSGATAPMGSGGHAYGADKVSLTELITNFNKPHGSTGKSEAEWVWQNINASWFNATLKTIGTGLVFKIAKKALRKPRTMINGIAKNQLGITEVRV